MASNSDSFSFPANIVFDAVELTVKNLGLRITFSDKKGGVLSCKSGFSFKSFGQSITITVSRVGNQISQLSINTESGQAYDWGEGKKLIEKIKSSVHNNLLLPLSTSTSSIVGGSSPDNSVEEQVGRAQEKAIHESNIYFQKSNRAIFGWFTLGIIVLSLAGLLLKPSSNSAMVSLVVGACMSLAWWVWGLRLPLQCPKCKIHDVLFLGSDERLVAVRSEQKHVFDRESRENHFARVTVSDIDTTSNFKCKSCNFKWSEVKRYTKEGN